MKLKKITNIRKSVRHVKLSFLKKPKLLLSNQNFFSLFVHVKSTWTLKTLNFSPARNIQLKWNHSSMNKKIPTVNCCLLWRILPTLCSNSRKGKISFNQYFNIYLKHTEATYRVYITKTCKTKCFHTNSKTSLSLRKKKKNNSNFIYKNIFKCKKIIYKC